MFEPLIFSVPRYDMRGKKWRYPPSGMGSTFLGTGSFFLLEALRRKCGSKKGGGGKEMREPPTLFMNRHRRRQLKREVLKKWEKKREIEHLGTSSS